MVVSHSVYYDIEQADIGQFVKPPFEYNYD
jgi:hypothetical protein